MPRGRGFTTKRVPLGGSRGVIIHRLGRRKRSPSDVSEGRPQLQPGIQHISNARLPAQRIIDNEIRRAELQGMWHYLHTLTPIYVVSL